MAKKKKVPATITVRRYDEEMGDSYDVEVKKEPVSNCELCSCAGCLDSRVLCKAPSSSFKISVDDTKGCVQSIFK